MAVLARIYLSGEFPHAERFETRVVLAAEVEIEPVSQLDLEEDSHVVRPLLLGNVDDEPTTQVVENMVGNRPIADRLLPIARLDGAKETAPIMSDTVVSAFSSICCIFVLLLGQCG